MFCIGLPLANVYLQNIPSCVYRKCCKNSILVFNARILGNSPIGYNTYDEIVVTRQINIGGKNKYLINGVMVQNNKVADFFQSVGLNINNPHFLIMQGRVTKGPGFYYFSKSTTDKYIFC